MSMNIERFVPEPEEADFAPADLARSCSCFMMAAIDSTSTAPAKAPKETFLSSW
jgi:hypothetical protein